MSFLKASYDRTIHDNTLLREGLKRGVRLDGRGNHDFRPAEIKTERGEFSSTAEVLLGVTRVVCFVRGEVVAPYPDRPTEGMVQFNAALSFAAESAGFTNNGVVRMLEKAIRESDAIDTESLCIVGGEHVWLITCDIRVLDYGGNILDASLLAASVAIRAFRKPDVSVVNAEGEDYSANSKLVFHKSDEREPLPLALHHTPLAVSFAIFADQPGAEKEVEGDAGDGNGDGSSSSSSSSLKRVLLVSDPIGEEEAVMDGSIMYSLNSDNELCALHKPGGVSLTPAFILGAMKTATIRSTQLHKDVDEALKELDARVEAERGRRVTLMQEMTARALQERAAKGTTASSTVVADEAGGISKNDVILSWQLLHRPSEAI